MRRVLTSVVVLTASAFACLPAPTTAQVTDRDALVTALDSAARAHAAHDLVAGVSVAVVRGADTLLLGGYGYADLEWDVPTPEDATASYEIGSVTKQFTAAAVMKLVEEGKLDLDADFTEYLDFDTRGHVVPLRRLLDHTSGIKGYTEMPSFGDLRMKELPRDSLVRLVEAEPFQFEPGTAQIYNNSAFFFLGLIVEEASGMSYEEYVEEKLFGALGMEDSYYCSEEAVREGRAHGYQGSPNGLVRKGYLDHTWPYAAGSLCSTAGDLVRWNQALHGGEVLSPESYRAMTTPMPLEDGTPIDYAMGLGVSERGGRRSITHGGGIPGFLTDGRYYPDEDLIVVVLQNFAGPRGPAVLGSALTELVLGPLPAPQAVPYEGDLNALVGVYEGPTRGGHMHTRVSRDGSALVVTMGDQEEGRRPVHVGDGVWEGSGLRFHFDMAGGRALRLHAGRGGSHYVLRRVAGG